MFLRNAILLALFGRSAIRVALFPLLSMTVVAAYFAFRRRESEIDKEDPELHLASPVSLKKVSTFGVLFLGIQVLGTLAVRWLGNSGVVLVSVLGGAISSAITTVAAANLLSHSRITALQAATATVLTSITSTGMNLPIVRRLIKIKSWLWYVSGSTCLSLVAHQTGCLIR